MNDFLDTIKKIPNEELRTNLARGRYGGSPDKNEYNLVQLELDMRKEVADNLRFNKTLKVSENLVSATRVLVIVTALLVLATLILALKGCG